MKKYLEDLEKELRKNNLPEQEIEEILSDHKEMIESAFSEGLMDEELEGKFGNPKDVAEELSSFSEQKQSKTTDSKIVFSDIKENYNVFIELINEDIKVLPHNQSTIIIESFGISNLQKYDIEYNDNILKLKAPKQRKSYFSIEGKKEFVIWLPKTIVINSFKARVINSDGVIKFVCSKEMKLNTNNGDFTFNDINTKSFSINSVNGDIIMSEIKSEEFELSLISGDMKAKQLKIKTDFSANTVSGDIKINDSGCDEFKLKTVSGDVVGNEFYPKKMSIRSVSGDIKIKNSDITKPIEILKKHSISGDINIVVTQKKNN